MAKQFLFSVFSETFDDGRATILTVERNPKILGSEFKFADLADADVAILNKLLRGEKGLPGIHDIRMQGLASKGVIVWTQDGWKMTDELRRLAAVEMLGKE